MPIHYELHSNHVVEITIDRYEKRNSLDLEHNAALGDAWVRFRDDPDAWVAVITGVKNVFCSGGDLNYLSEVAREVRATGGKQFGDMREEQRSSLKGLDIFKPVIAAVNGYCVAGGMEILGATDIRIASTEAVFQIAEPRRGLIAFGGTMARLPRQLSWPAAMELLLVAGPVPAERALQLGLINLIVEPDELAETARSWAAEITKSAPLAVQATKRVALRSVQTGSIEAAYAGEDEAFREVFATEDATEGPRAFLEKREPIWKGR